jgi:hypothetical protein
MKDAPYVLDWTSGGGTEGQPGRLRLEGGWRVSWTEQAAEEADRVNRLPAGGVGSGSCALLLGVA